ncbi:hypothetical protein CXF83_16900 [Shewanella sp. Choline-02u-19]|uniref:hypothetical protein n=1 Tax=unclassified Shewanella TaxID=196818 RepID=UPI000C33C02C|nr:MULTISPECIES: hypothetical protein [unclassified Shewanella]PKG59100.1 hypothetical protein CXF82_01040 [Shewanella sp. GutDb-MelDb]PKG76287.1 hypothetical protein CXF86_02085 [Shewanella sp. GutCb]PKH57432.1 hypothetical protein CXF84_09005 [Shewanella sp. Bg11-22]PKI28267.1 hypothetical protein CXF83_16900 [Shewanella sp. Choline-02u-19]
MVSDYQRPSLRDDPRVNKALLNMPSRYANSYTEAQLVYFRFALVDNQWQKHFIDHRGTFYFPFIGWRFFYVFLLGRNKRALNRKEKQLSVLIFALSVVSFIVISMVFGLLLLYLLKSALGIDLFENSSLGIWDWFKS